MMPTLQSDKKFDKHFILNKRGQNKNLHCEKLARERCWFKQPRQLMPFAFLHNYLFSNLFAIYPDIAVTDNIK